jgi:hypothetical protein
MSAAYGASIQTYGSTAYPVEEKVLYKRYDLGPEKCSRVPGDCGVCVGGELRLVHLLLGCRSRQRELRFLQGTNHWRDCTGEVISYWRWLLPEPASHRVLFYQAGDR